MILITGANGQLGTELRHLLDSKGIVYVGTDVQDMDITNAESVRTKFEEVKPDIVFHVAAYTAVDKAEDEGKSLDEAINVQGTKNIVEASAKLGAKLFYISTDYVFDGTKKDGEYFPEDTTNPLNEYGRTKRLGEEAVLAYDRSYVIRTSWVFGNYGHNFVFTMQNLAKTHPKLTVVNDQLGRPTWTKTLADFMLYAVEKEEKVPFGIYHLSNDETATWYDFARAILKDTATEVLPLKSAEFPQKARRPQYSVINLDKTKATGFVIPTWKQALQGMLSELQ